MFSRVLIWLLVAIGSAASVFFGLFALYMMLIVLSAGNEELVAKYAHNLYFDSAAMILTLITVGKYFEARAKRELLMLFLNCWN